MGVSFGTCLRQYRRAAALTQESLAERAGISATGIAALEAGRRRTPRLSTVLLLVDALQLDEPARRVLIDAASAPAVEPDQPERASGQRRTPTGSEPGHKPDSEPDDAAQIGSPIIPSATNRPLAPPHLGLPPHVALDRPYGFVGRAAELSRLTTAWEQRRRVVLVVGEAGVGKTRLVERFAASLAPGEAVVLWGRCTAERLGSYEPFVEPLRTILRARGGTAFVERNELARLLPELHTDGQRSAVPTTADPAVERRMLFEAVAAACSDLGRVLLVLDDVQWADAASMALLDHLVSSAAAQQVLVVATVRSTDLTPEQGARLSALRRRGSFERIPLAGLGLDDLTTLVTEIAGDETSAELLHAVAEATEGNPLYIEELTEHLLDRRFGSTATANAVPDGVRDTLSHRLAGLSVDAQSLLRCGAVLGREFEPLVAGELAGLDGSRLIAACEDALLSGLVNEASASTLSFSHALVRTAVYESISSLRRADVHRRAAVMLETTEPMDTRTIVDLLRHWSVVTATDPSSMESAATWAMRAGDAAADAAATDEAIDFYRQAVAFSSRSTPSRADALIRLGIALSNSGRTADADEQFRAALAVADAVGAPALYARAALGLSSPVRYGQSDPERIEVVESAIARLGPHEVDLRPALLTMLVRQLGFDQRPGSYERRQEAAGLVAAAISDPDASDELILALGSNRDSIPLDHPVPLSRFSHRVIAIAEERRDLPAQTNGWYGAAWSALELGDSNGWREAISRYAALSEQLQMPYERHLAAVMAATAALMEGRYEDARTSADEALLQGNLLGRENAGAVWLTNAVLRGLDLGHAAVMLELMTGSMADYANVGTFIAGLTMTAAFAGERALALRLLDEHGASRFTDVKRDAEWLPVIGFFCSAAAGVADERHAHALHDLLVTSPAATIRVGPLAGWWGAVDHHLGSLDRVLGRLDDAATRLESALAIERSMGAAPFVARTQLELATVLERRRRPGDAERSAALRSDALATASALGATGVLAAVG